MRRRTGVQPEVWFFLRHARAADAAPGEADAARPLTRDGERRLDDVLRLAGALGIRPDLILHSPAVRTTQTALRAADRLAPEAPMVEAPWLWWERTVEEAVAAMRHVEARAPLLVGHEPLLSALAARCIGARSARITLKKAGLAVVDVAVDNGRRRGSLRLLLTPAVARNG